MKDFFSLAGLMRDVVSPVGVDNGRYDGPDRRHGARWPSFCFVEVCHPDGSPLSAATIREISSFGAQLRLKSAANIPGRLIVRSRRDICRNYATVNWIFGVSVGVRFDKEIMAPDQALQAGKMSRTSDPRILR